VKRTLGIEKTGSKWPKRLGLLSLGAALIGGSGYGWYRFGRPTPIEYRTARAAVGDLTVTVSATGTLQPRAQVEVGPQISGRIASVHADFNDQVKAGQVLVELDRAQLTARLNEARARLVAAQAALRDARVASQEAEQNLARTKSLVAEGVAPAQQLDTTNSLRDRSLAGIETSKANVSLAQAALAAARTDLEWATIRAPISGVILSRAAEPGQVVAATFQPPILFVIAEDLRTMELRVDIDEADVGRVKAGQHARFDVDAYPGRAFDAKLESVRNSARTVQNVVTYEGILSVDNSDEALKPGMTASVTITTERERGALLVPNAALRFTPPSVQEKPEERRNQRVWQKDGEGVKRVEL
jgi:HlyD family secretion protein